MNVFSLWVQKKRLVRANNDQKYLDFYQNELQDREFDIRDIVELHK